MSEQRVDTKAHLGCGTLIVIALIVILFSGGRETKKLRTQLDETNRKLDRLEQKIDEMSTKLEQRPPAAP